MKSSILVSTLGATWQVIPELLGWTNPEQVDLYREHDERQRLEEERLKHNLEPVNEIWVLMTSGEKPEAALVHLRKWFECWNDGNRKLRVWKTKGAHDINSMDEMHLVRELIWRSVLHAKEQSLKGQLLLSLAGGRKTMSADMQTAAVHFGSRALLHIIDRGKQGEDQPILPEDFLIPFPNNWSCRYLPVVLGSQRPNPILEKFSFADYPLNGGLAESEASEFFPDEPWLIKDIEEELEHSRHLSFNYRHQLLENDKGTNFLDLYTLDKEKVKELQNSRFGIDPEKETEELNWLGSLPKAELHCHLGGVLGTADMIHVAECLKEEISESQSIWGPELSDLSLMVEAEELEGIIHWLKEKSGHSKRPFKALRKIGDLKEPLGVCAFLLLFQKHPEVLARLTDRVAALSEDPFERYECSGDLQGSGLLQHEKTIFETAKTWLEQCKSHNVKYLELRCSPANYTRGGLSPEEVVDTIRRACLEVPEVETGLLFIGSRHGRSEDLKTHIKLARKLLDQEENGQRAGALVGFDLAGAEEQQTPADLREAFLPLLERCLSVTIHAGETEPARSVWEAVYHLQADRIGHGLTLRDSSELIPRFRDRRIGIELCPSSNMQIIGFRDAYCPKNGNTVYYPLREYLESGLRVTINTDNPGISKTNPTLELHKAARMTEGGLSQWEILLLVRNSFRAAFTDHQNRSRLLREAEEDLMSFMQKEPL